MWNFSLKAVLVGGFIAAAGAGISTMAKAESGIVSRADVKAEMLQLKQAGYNPASDHTQYPKNIQLAEQRVAEQRVAEQQRLNGTGYGPLTNGTAASGARSVGEDTGSVYPINFGRP